ncbi:MAG: amino acid adenylation domain-containing protein [Fibrobacterota bacterium]|nr:amino acid adenylation domain-containing protein [Fibrobacterota bacterium]QQS06579.1 MAG: amino acid adenylation domain-containing protein [Fibrobacterota bacterium]
MKPTIRIQPVPRTGEGLPLSLLQERLWILHRMNPGDTSWNIPFVFLIEGNLDLATLARCLGEILRRHENLRARFVAAAGTTPVQLTTPPTDPVLEPVDASESEIDSIVKEHAQHRFDLENGPVFAHKLVRTSPLKHLLLINIHHIVADGWSIEGIFFSELLKCYEAFSEGRAPELPELPIQYGDYSTWQRKQDISKHLAYWRDSLLGYEGSLELPTDHLRQADSGKTSASFLKHYDSKFCQDLDRFSQKHNATLFMSLLAGFALLAQRYTGNDDVCIGTTTSGRQLPELEGLIGFFINILPLRIQIDRNLSVKDYMALVRQTAVRGFEHQAAPFERILQSLDSPHKVNGGQLVPVIVRHQNFPHTKMDKPLPGGVRLDAYSQISTEEATLSQTAKARCEVELSYTGNRESLQVEAVFAADLYRKSTIDRILEHHQHLLLAMIEDDSRPIGELAMMDAEEIHRVCLGNGATLAGSNGSDTFVERFDAQVSRTPDRTACIDRSGVCTYRELSSRSHRLAHALRAKGVGPGDVVGICLERDASLLASFLAVWKTGAAYVPVDPSYPDSYRSQILSDAAPKIVVGTAATLAGIDLAAGQTFALDKAAESLAGLPESGLPVVATPDSLAYIMYTSGSTGTPKGVRVPHRQLVNWLGGIEANWPFSDTDVVGQKTTIAFAPSVKELFAGLLNGAPQVFIDGATMLDTRAFVEALASHGVTRLNLVPSHLEGVLGHLESDGATLAALRMCITAGEPLSSELVAKFRRLVPGARLVNNYGCTELNDITYYDTTDFDAAGGFVPAGRPIQNTRIYLLDAEKRLVPDGVAGELHVASIGMPEGYHNLPDLNAAQFSSNAFPESFGDRLFNTGDLARRLADGNIEYIGRRDFQVKVRGQRVDVRHVEKVLGDFHGIGQRAVVSDGSQLSAYYVSSKGASIDIEALRLFLLARLPGFMVPAAFVALEAMPRLPNGKLDRRSLKPSAGQIQQSRAYEAPSNKVERQLAAIWSMVLGFSLEEIGRHSHFFEIGGDSLAAARVMGYIHERLGAEVGMSLLFENPRLIQLGEAVGKTLKEYGWSEEASGGDELPLQGSEAFGSPDAKGAGLLAGKVVLITGASRGIGSTAAILLASQGAKVAINFRKSEARALRVKELIESEGGIAELFQADVTVQEEVDAMVAMVLAKFGKIDVLVSNAAIGFKMRSFLEFEWEDFQRKVNDEVAQLFFLCKAVAPAMVAQGTGSIISVSSTMSKSHGNGFISHSAAKAALDAFVRSLAAEFGPSGVRVNTVAPGLILTDATANLPPSVKDSAAAWTPLRRNGAARDVAGAILYFASDMSKFVTGSYQAVDGGMTML